MKFKKEIIAAITCAVVLVGIFLTVSFIGKKDAALSTNNGNDKKVTETEKDKKKQDENKDNESKKTNSKETKDKENNDKEKKVETNNPDNPEEKKENEKKVNNNNDKPQEDKKEDENKSSDKNPNSSLTKEEGIKEGIYVIQKNDTLYSIANAYMPSHDTSLVIETIMKRNNFNSSNKIIQGQEIIIPYEVALETKATSTSTEDDKKKENLKETDKKADDKKEPSKETDKKVDEKNTDEKKEDNKEKLSGNKYEIKSGDNLYSIAKEKMPEISLKEAVEKIKAFNEIKDEDAIRAGEVIYIPAK
ncbi:MULTISPECIES: LysM peptidoglycan-binding domain-containing protein [unclassified Clostridium]|uniref:LysM peptidoglycan-binding domain-containing protein n=1 Tax=unclassified Clostridium TaxID=2614128 RepID=UPI0025C6C8E8|nr:MULTISPECIES: LysM peptidoglycan-binding domain-containing protein [unclassified Clostridium]